MLARCQIGDISKGPQTHTHVFYILHLIIYLPILPKKTQQLRYHCCSSLVFHFLPHSLTRPPPALFPHCFVSSRTCSSGVLPTLGWSTTNVASDLCCWGKAVRLPNTSHKTNGGGGSWQIRCGRRWGAESFIKRLRSWGFQTPRGEGDATGWYGSYTGMGTCHSSAWPSAVLVRLVDVADEIKDV